MDLSPVTLAGTVVRLEPLALSHLDGLCAVGLEPSLWTLTQSVIASCDDMRAYVEEALAEQRAGVALPFATVDPATGTVIGSTRFGSASHEHRRIEIGWTWIAPRWQRTAVNTEAKYLMLRHAFETMGARRVELKTSSLNTRSRQAMLRIGATEEGVLRQHMIRPDGSSRDSVYFSVIDIEWPAVKARLEGMMKRD
ncbi:MAG: N-acetyltransferase [Gemmatimonadetes bacterium]|jgi:RimJ/RimL family protein N-acetyltransferase|nr:N-acetyltransferase [Gemmatimonadota bacterium]